MNKEYDVAIVGAGPSGLIAAHELTQRFGKNIRVGVFDKGDGIASRTCPSRERKLRCMGCNPCGIVEGIMGAGLRSDGKLHFHPEVMEVFRMGLINESETRELLRYLENSFERWGLVGPAYPLDDEKSREMSKIVRDLNLGDSFELKEKKRTRHVGSDRLPLIVSNLLGEIQRDGDVEIHLRTEFTGYDFFSGGSRLFFQKGRTKEEYDVSKVFVGLGRRGSATVQQMVNELSIPFTYRPVEVGGRVEVPYQVMAPVTDVVYNPCFRQKNEEGVATFTFCANPRGFVMIELLLNGVVGVNGESRTDIESTLTNFAVLTELPVGTDEDPNSLLSSMLRSNFSGDAPLLQTTADFMDGTMRDRINGHTPTVPTYEYAEVSKQFPSAVTEQLRSFLTRLDVVSPGVISHDSYFIAPEAKIRGIRVEPRSSGLETSVNGLYLIGDSSGLSGNITAAAMTGVLAARDVA